MSAKRIFSLLFLILFVALKGYSGDQSRPEKVYVGVYLNDISDFDTKQGRFKADIHLWVKWLGTTDVPPISISNAEIDTREINNQESDHEWHSVRWRVQGTFRGNFPLYDFPFDKQQICIQIDMPAEWGILIPDQAGSGMSSQFSITGWDYEPYFNATQESKTYSSDLGSIDHEGVRQQVSSVTYSLELDRPFAANFIKLIVPLIIIIMMATLAFFLSATQLVVRNGMVVTALLSCVAFHFSQSESLPDVSYLVAADKFFLGAYSLIIFALIGVVTSFRICEKSPKWSNRVDIGFGVLIPIIAVLVGGNISYTHELKTKVPEVVEVKKVERPVKKSSRDTLHKAVPILPDMFESHNEYLFMRGLYYTGKDGAKIPHLVTEVPDMTNDLIRLLADGGISVKWKLKPDLKWGDGKLITADDLVFSLKCKEDDNRREINKIDEMTVEVIYNQRFNNVVHNFDVFPRHQFKNLKKGSKLEQIHEILKTSPPPMDGPYVMKDFVPEKYVLFERNKYFPGNEARIKFVKISVNKEGERWMSPREIFEKRRADLISLMSKNSFNSVTGLDQFVQRIDSTSNGIFFLQPDLSKAPFDDTLVRKAISYAINRKAIIDSVDEGAGVSTISSYHTQFEDIEYNYNPSKAKQLLKQADFAPDTEIDMVGFSYGAGTPDYMVMSIIKENLEAVGFKVNLDAQNQETKELLRKGNHGKLLYYAGTKEDPGLFWNVPYNAQKGRFEMGVTTKAYSDDVLTLFKKYEGSMFKERRSSLSKKLERIYAQKLPTIPIFSISYRSVYHKKLIGWDPMAADKQNVWWNVEDWYFK